MTNKTAILFFARTPEEEASAKGWTASKLLNLKLSRLLHHKVSAVLAQSNLPVFTNDDYFQRGHNFNERITNALADFFEQGYDNTIVVGSDCADLSIQDIQKAEANFHFGKYTYGASFDGGVYLFTLSKVDFDKEKLLNLPWCTKGLSLALLECIYEQSSHTVESLQRKVDFDDNLKQLRPFLRFVSRTFRKLILAILDYCNHIVTKESSNSYRSFSLPYNKGSPTRFLIIS